MVEHLMESNGLDSITNLKGKNKIHNTNLNRAKLRSLLGLNVRLMCPKDNRLMIKRPAKKHLPRPSMLPDGVRTLIPSTWEAAVG